MPKCGEKLTPAPTRPFQPTSVTRPVSLRPWVNPAPMLNEKCENSWALRALTMSMPKQDAIANFFISGYILSQKQGCLRLVQQMNHCEKTIVHSMARRMHHPKVCYAMRSF